MRLTRPTPTDCSFFAGRPSARQGCQGPSRTRTATHQTSFHLMGQDNRGSRRSATGSRWAPDCCRLDSSDARPKNGKHEGIGVVLPRRCSRMRVRAGIPRQILQFSGTTRLAKDEIIARQGEYRSELYLLLIRSRECRCAEMFTSRAGQRILSACRPK